MPGALGGLFWEGQHSQLLTSALQSRLSLPPALTLRGGPVFFSRYLGYRLQVWGLGPTLSCTP